MDCDFSKHRRPRTVLLRHDCFTFLFSRTTTHSTTRHTYRGTVLTQDSTSQGASSASESESDTDTDTQAPQTGERPKAPARSKRAAILGWAVTLSLNVVAPIITYKALRDHGFSEFAALLISSAWPVVDGAVHLAWRRRLDELAIVTLVFIVITAVVSTVGAHSARALLIKDSCVTGLFGVLCLATLLAPRPLMFYLGRKFATDGTEASTAWWNGLWHVDGFRKAMMTMTTVWGVAYCIESAVRVVLSYSLSTDTMVVLSPVLIYAVLGSLGTWTALYGKRSRRKGEARAAAAAAAAAEAEAEAKAEPAAAAEG
ncbi:VC0807 family protein [Streptomyces endocoffeicus]|uniref:VC0807 family protein n=1 Tax=Streptomyces endocoffeicus TaxID=2898945 RepID=UPI001E326680|nr:VC0807 family protein [Streptomyces endocoffeicus]